MKGYFEVLSPPINKLYIDDVEYDCTNKTVNIDRAYFVGFESVDSTSTKPSIYDSGVVYNGEIHFIGSSKANPSVGMHCKFDGTNWTSNVSTLPYNPAYCKAIVYNDEIHIFGGAKDSTTKKKNLASQKYHYKLNKDTNTWEKVSSLPYYFYAGSAVVYNGQIHILGGGRTNTTKKKHYYYNQKSKAWKSAKVLNQLLYGFYKAFVVTRESGEEVLYFCGEKSLKGEFQDFSRVYYYNKSKKSWKIAIKFDHSFVKGADPSGPKYAYIFTPYGSDIYMYSANNTTKYMYKDKVEMVMVNESTGMYETINNYLEDVYSLDFPGRLTHMFFLDGTLYLFREDATNYKLNSIVYTLDVK